MYSIRSSVAWGHREQGQENEKEKSRCLFTAEYHHLSISRRLFCFRGSDGIADRRHNCHALNNFSHSTGSRDYFSLITFISEPHFGLVTKLSFAARPCNLDRCMD
jgi:hypothetical protein